MDPAEPSKLAPAGAGKMDKKKHKTIKTAEKVEVEACRPDATAMESALYEEFLAHFIGVLGPTPGKKAMNATIPFVQRIGDFVTLSSKRMLTSLSVIKRAGDLVIKPQIVTDVLTLQARLDKVQTAAIISST